MLDLQDFKYGFRQLVNRPGFTLVTVLTLALGIGANTAIFSVVKGVLFETAPYEDADALVWMGEHTEQVPNMSVAYPNFLDWRERNRSFEALAAHRYDSMNFTGTDRPEQLRVLMTSASLFPEVLKVEPKIGRTFSPEEDLPGQGAVAVVSHDFWQRRLGGDDEALGRQILLDGEPREVIGVMPPGFMYPLVAVDVSAWLPLGHVADQPFMASRDNHPGIYVTARMADGVSFEQARDDMVALAANLAAEYPETNTGDGVFIAPLRDHVVRHIRPAVLVLSGAVFLVLLIACVNVANLLLVRGTARAREIAVRSALGAGTWRVTRQLLTESVLLSALGGLAGIGVAYGGLTLLLRFTDSAFMPRVGEIHLDQGTLAFTLVLSLLTGVLFGAAPAIQAARRDQVTSLKEGTKGSEGGRRQHLRSLLVISQVALALILLAGALLFLQSFENLIDADPGFDPEGVLAFDLTLSDTDFPEDVEKVAFTEAFLERLRALPQVEAASTTLPLLGGYQTSILAEGRPEPPPGEALSVDITRVSPDYFEVMGIDLQKGRVFDDRDRADSRPVAVVDRTLVDTLFPGEEPLGKRFQLAGLDELLEIVGVVDHVKNYGVAEFSRIEVYVPAAQSPTSQVTYVLQADAKDPRALVPALEAELGRLSASQPLANPRLVSDEVDSTVLAGRILAGMLSIFAGLAMLLAALGIYGIMAFHVHERRQEIGIRMALGARASHIFQWLGLEGLKLVVAGTLVGMIGVFWAGPFLGSELFGVEPRDPATLLVLPLLVLGIAALASMGPLRRARQVEPVTALRHE